MDMSSLRSEKGATGAAARERIQKMGRTSQVGLRERDALL